MQQMRSRWMAMTLALTATGCFSLVSPAVNVSIDRCVVDPALAGTWTDTRLTQLGPVWEKVTFNCDCTFTMRAQLLWARFTDRGLYGATGAVLHIGRTSGVLRWPYRIDGDTLHMTQAPGEVITYQQSGTARACQSSASPLRSGSVNTRPAASRKKAEVTPSARPMPMPGSVATRPMT
jgi:hypothetical protein